MWRTSILLLTALLLSGEVACNSCTDCCCYHTDELPTFFFCFCHILLVMVSLHIITPVEVSVVQRYAPFWGVELIDAILLVPSSLEPLATSKTMRISDSTSVCLCFSSLCRIVLPPNVLQRQSSVWFRCLTLQRNAHFCARNN